MAKADILRKLNRYKKNPELYQPLSPNELADLVVVVLSQVSTIEQAIKEGRLDGYTPKPDKDYLSLPTAQKLLSKAVKDMVAEYDSEMRKKGSALEEQVQAAIQRIRDGKDGIITDEEIGRAAQLASQLIDLPDFDEEIQKAITSDGESIRNALELLQGDERYKVEIADVQGLEERLEALRRSEGGNPMGTSKPAVYQFIRDAIADGIITTGGGSVSDEAYGVSWDGVTDVAPSKNAVYDKIQSLPGGHDAVTVTDSPEIDFTLTGQNITASLVAGSIDETKLDASVNASLDLADSASQPGHTHATSDITSGTFDDARIAESNVTQHQAALSITESQISDLGNYEIKAVANGSLTAVNDTFYVCVSNSTFTDPSPVEGEGFAVLVRNGTATVGGTGYSTAGTIIHRTFHSGSWTNYVYLPSSSYYAPGGTDVALADGGTGASLTDPNADRIMFWDDSAGAVTWLTASTGLTISGTNMTVRTSSATQTGIVELATDAETVTGTDTARATTPANLTAKMAAPGAIGGTTPNTIAGTLITYNAARGKVTAGGNLGATETINFNSETNYTGTLDSNITFTFANATSGDEVVLFLSYDGTAQRTITWPTVTWLDNSSGAAPTTPAASGNVLVVTVRYIGSTFYASATGNYAVYA